MAVEVADWAAVGLGVSVTRMAVVVEVDAVASRFSVGWAAEGGVSEVALDVVEVFPELGDVVDASEAGGREISMRRGGLSKESRSVERLVLIEGLRVELTFSSLGHWTCGDDITAQDATQKGQGSDRGPQGQAETHDG